MRTIHRQFGTMLQPEGNDIDVDRLRVERRQRVFDAMAAASIDVLLLGRPANGLYATGARQLWTAGARPFGPACVVVGSTGRTHLLSTWDEGVPAEVAHDDLFGLSWNPAVIMSSLQEIPGIAGAGRIGTDSMSPGFGSALRALSPNAEVVDATPVLRSARATKSRDEVACISTATAIAEAAMASMVDALRPGITERELVGIFVERIASLGAPTSPSEGVVCATPRNGPVQLRRVASSRAVASGELVVLDPGARFLGYEGGVGRTWIVDGEVTGDQRSLGERCATSVAAVIDACRPGARGRELKQAWRSTGEPLPPVPLAYGVGLGMEEPIVADGVGDDDEIHEGSVIAVTGWVAAEGAGGHLERELVLVQAPAATVLSRYGRMT